MLSIPFYDPNKSYEENYKDGPFGAFQDDAVIERKGKPEYDFLGQKLYLPFGIPAGPLLNSKYIKAAFQKGFDICVYKTVRTKSYPCHPWPNVLAVHLDGDLTPEKAQGTLYADSKYKEPLSITNSFGVPSMDPDIWQPDMKKAVDAAGKGQVMVGSFQGTTSGSTEGYIKDFVNAAKQVKETGAKILEANLSCPNEGTGHLLCFDVERTRRIAEAIKDEIGSTPLILKMAYFEDNALLGQFVKEVGTVADGFAAINTIASTIVDANGQQALPGNGRARSGVCGTAIKWAGLDMVKRLQQIREQFSMKYTIIGGGGVMSAVGYNEYRNAGADAVTSATGAMWDPTLAINIAKNEQ